MSNRSDWQSVGKFFATEQCMWMTMQEVANWHGVPIAVIDWLRTGPGAAPLMSACLHIVEAWKKDRIFDVVQSARSLGAKVELCRVWNDGFSTLINQLGLTGRDEDVSETNFPYPPTNERYGRFWNFHFDFAVKRDEVIRIMASAGYRPATVIEFLSWLVFQGEHNSGIEYPIVALGQVWNGSAVKICKAGGGGRCLAREWIDRPSRSEGRFLGVRLVEGEQPLDWQI